MIIAWISWKNFIKRNSSPEYPGPYLPGHQFPEGAGAVH
jgi:hypothetical protein